MRRLFLFKIGHKPALESAANSPLNPLSEPDGRGDMTDGRGGGANPPRIAIWSVPPGWWYAYFVIYSLKVSFWAAAEVQYELEYGAHAHWKLFANAVAHDTSPYLLASAASTLMLLEGARSIMVFSNYLIYKLLNPTKERLREEGREQGLQRGREEGLEKGREQGINQVLQMLSEDERERLQAKLQAAQSDDPAQTRNGAR